jgi:hypothetical protein
MCRAEPFIELIIRTAIDGHDNTGPGLLEAKQEQYLCVELRRAGVAFARQVSHSDVLQGQAGR